MSATPMVQYGSGPIVFKAARRSSRERSIHKDEDCRHLDDVENVLDKPLPAVSHKPKCPECFDDDDRS